MRKLIFLIITLIGNQAYSGTSFEVPAGSVDHVRVEGIGGVGRYILQFKSGYAGDAGCSTRDFAYIRATDESAKEMYSTALSAFVSGKTLVLTTTGCDSFGNVIQSVGIK